MVERMVDMPAGTLGFRIDGDIEDDDYEHVLVPALKGAIEGGGRLRTLYLIEDVDDVEGEAMWADAKLGFDLGIKHHGAWERSAIVTDLKWMARAAHLFAWMIPGEARVFPVSELPAAKAWVKG